MTNRILKIFAVAAVLAALAAPALYAQMGTKVVANIPFDFIVGVKTLPAGQYTLTIGMGNTPGVVGIETADRHFVLRTLSTPVYTGAAPGKGNLLFNRYGEQYFLSRVWTGQGAEASQLPQTKREREVLKSTKVPEPIVVAATR